MSRGFKFTEAQINEIVAFAFTADKEARSDLARDYIANENDYTSNFTGALRRIVNSNSATGLSATSFVLKGGDEQRAGCDAAIVLRSGDEAKVSLFEAKWPRIMTGHYRWDSEQTSKGLSHFTDQLDRQSQLHKSFAVFEMFYCEAEFGKQPQFMQPNGSTCVWHEEAMAFNSGRTDREAVWGDSDIKGLLTGHKKGIGEIFDAICRCHKGKPIGMRGFQDLKAMSLEYSLPNLVLTIAGNLDS